MNQPFDPGPAGPVVSDDPSGRWMRWALAAVVAVALAFAAVKAVGGRDDDGVAADRVGEVLGGPDRPADEADAGRETPQEPQEPEAPPSTAPAAPTDLFADATKPFEVYAGIFDGAPVKVYELLIYPDWSRIEVQQPGQPTYVDEYTWRGGNGVSGPEPVDMLGMEIEELPEKLFDLTELDAGKIPGMVEQAKAQFTGEGVEVSHIIVDRFLPFDTRVIVRVYVDEERSGGGYVQFTPDGVFVETVA